MIFFKKKATEPRKDVDMYTLYSPIKGTLKCLEEVEDPVFSKLMMGNGVAIEPLDGNLYSPVNGVISVVFASKHVIGIQAENGKNIILHIGIDTVELKGKGFNPQIKVGDRVKVKDLLMKFDLKQIQKNFIATVMVVVENEMSFMERKTYGEIQVGEEIIRLKRT